MLTTNFKDKKSISNNDIMMELIKNQLPNIDEEKRLYLHDIKRIAKNLMSSIFDKEVCSLWNGYITNLNKANKGTYINFYFRKKKVALHRLLYANYIGPIDNTEYIKYSCQHKGYCCNVNCLKKFKYNSVKSNKKIIHNMPNKKNYTNEEIKNKLCIEFN